jgi:hypothetical protein
MRITVKTSNVQTETTNKGTVLYKQFAAIDRGEDHPLVFAITVPEGRPYAPGDYVLDQASFRNNRFGGLELDPYQIKLVPMKAVKAA